MSFPNQRWATRLALLFAATVSLVGAACAHAKFIPGPGIWGAASGEPGEITLRFTEVRLPPSTDVHYRISVGRVHAVFVTPWVQHFPFPDRTDFYFSGRRTLWSDPITGRWYTRGPDCCAGPTWEYTATSDATGTVHGETSYRWQADPGAGWMLSHYSISRALVEDIDNSVRSRQVLSYRIRCEQWSRGYLYEVRHASDEPPRNPTERPSCQVEVPATRVPDNFWFD